MPRRSLAGRLRVIAGSLAGAENVARAQGLDDIRAALTDLRAAVKGLIIAVDRLDQLRASVAAQRAELESRDAA